MTITVVPFAHQDTAGLRPLHDGVVTDVLTARSEARVDLTTQQEGQVFVKPTATIVARIDDDSIVIAVLTEELLIGRTEAVGIHRRHDDVGDTSSAELLDHILTLLDPATMEEILLRRLIDRTDELLEALTTLGIQEGDADALTDLTIEVELYGATSINDFSIDLLDDQAGLNLITQAREWATSEDFLNLQAITRVLLIVVRPEVTGLLRPTLGVNTCTSVRSIQLTEEFAEHFTEVLIVGDIGEELTISRAVVVPVNTVKIDVVELLLDLLPSMVEDISTFGCWAMLKLGCEANGLEATTIELIEPRRSPYIDRLTILAKHQATAPYIGAQELRGFLLQVTLPQVVGIFILSDIVELRTIIRDDGIRERARSTRQANGTIVQIRKVRGKGLRILSIRLS